MDETTALLGKAGRGETKVQSIRLMGDPVFHLDDMEGRAYQIDRRMSGCYPLICTKPLNFDVAGRYYVDGKLIALAKDTGSMIVTNDFNLNKVASIQGIQVLNINDLANAMKPVVIPGEEMTAYLLREGKESGQAIAYLQDGTMIVVEGGRKYIGNKIKVAVTSVLQTSAGRMIFAKVARNQVG